MYCTKCSARTEYFTPSAISRAKRTSALRLHKLVLNMPHRHPAFICINPQPCTRSCYESPTQTSRPTSHRPRARARAVSRRAVLQALTLLTASPAAHALCGAPDPYSAHYLPWDETLIPLSDSRSLHIRLVGRTRGKPPLLILPDAGAGLAAGEPLEILGTKRRIIQADFLGVGDSSPLTSDVNRVAVASTEALAALDSEKVPVVHVLAAGFGISVARQLAVDDRIASVVVEAWNPILSTASLKDLLGSRPCAVEAAQAGDIGLTRATSVKGFLEDVRFLSERVPTLALRGSGESEVDGMPGLKQRAVDMPGRLPHLAASNDTLFALQEFYADVDKKNGIAE